VFSPDKAANDQAAAIAEVQQQQEKVDKALKIAKEREQLLAQPDDPAALTTTRARVAYILNQFPETRDSDVKLYFRYWQTFHFGVIGGSTEISEEDMLRMVRPTVLTRARAKIQNEYELYQPSAEVQGFRVGRRQEFEDETIRDKPGEPLVFVYCDESGKTQEYALVGSVWMYNGFQAGGFARDIAVWKAQNSITGEFHFQQIHKGNLEHAKVFFEQAVKRADLLCFKVVAIRQKGLSRRPAEIIERLYYELIHSGLEHDLERGRITLPRSVHVTKDKEDGTDLFAIRDLEQRLTTHFQTRYDSDVVLAGVEVAESTSDLYIQLADLFTGAVNRVLNAPGHNPKDEFAEFVLKLLGLEVTRDGVTAVGGQDVATVIMLPTW
jgi:hypothetical protein